jgi:hypothetical protein
MEYEVKMNELPPKIFWKRLQKICSEITQKEVQISGTTNLPDNMMAGVKASKTKVDIVINLNNVKDLDTLFSAISHELAHNELSNAEHTIIHNEIQEQIKTEIKNKYEGSYE